MPGDLPIDVVIPTVGRPTLKALLSALAADPPSAQGTVFVVDDRARPDPPLDIPPGMVVCFGGGRGPAAARNVGWRAGDAPWVVFLDDDVALTAGWARALRDDLAALAESYDVVSQGQLHVPLSPQRRPTDAERNVARLEGAPWLTADLAVSRWALSLCGGFDERFPRAYREDTELAIRLRRGGVSRQRGTRWVLHPPRPAPWYESIKRQRGNADDARLRRLYGRRWRALAQVGRGRFVLHATTVAALFAIPLSRAERSWLRRFGRGAALYWLASTGQFAAARLAPGPRLPREIASMTVTSAAIPPLALLWRTRGWCSARRAPWPSPAAVLFDRDGTLIEDVPYNGDPDRVQLRTGAAEAVARLRAHGIPVGLITNQSGVAKGLLTMEAMHAVNDRVQALLGPFDVVEVCPHAPTDRCRCRKPKPAMVARAAARLGVDARRCWVIGDIAADVQAAHAANAQAVLVPNAFTRPDEQRLAPHVVSDLEAAVALVLSGQA